MSKISEFYKRLRELCEERNMTVNEFVKILNLSSGSPTAWKNGAIPRNSTVKKIADYFGVSVDYLLGNVSDPFFHLDNERILADINSYEENEKSPTKDGERIVVDPEHLPFYSIFKRLPKEQQKILIDLANQFIQWQERNEE